MGKGEVEKRVRKQEKYPNMVYSFLGYNFAVCELYTQNLINNF